MLILILSDVQYSENAVFSFEKSLDRQNHSRGSHHLVKKFLPSPQQNSSPSNWGGICLSTPYRYLENPGIHFNCKAKIFSPNLQFHLFLLSMHLIFFTSSSGILVRQSCSC